MGSVACAGSGAAAVRSADSRGKSSRQCTPSRCNARMQSNRAGPQPRPASHIAYSPAAPPSSPASRRRFRRWSESPPSSGAGPARCSAASRRARKLALAAQRDKTDWRSSLDLLRQQKPQHARSHRHQCRNHRHQKPPRRNLYPPDWGSVPPNVAVRFVR